MSLPIALLTILFGGAKIVLAFWQRALYEERFCEIILNLDQWFRRRCRLTGFFYLELLRPSCLAERNYLGNFDRRYKA